MASRQNSTRQGQAKKAPPISGGGFDEYKEAIEAMDSEKVLKIGQENYEIRYPDDESSDEESFTDRQRRLTETPSRRMNQFIERRRSIIKEGKWTNLEGDEYMELLDIIDRQIDNRPGVNTDEYLQNLLQVISRFRLFTPSMFKSADSPLKMYPSPGQRFTILQEKIYNLLSDRAQSTANNYAYGGNRKAKVLKTKPAKKSLKAKSAKKTLKGKKHQKKTEKHSKKTKKSRR